MEPRYVRNIPALTEEEWKLLQSRRILVVGCGGLGGHLIDMLARIGVGALRVVDGDVFEPSNLNRLLLSQVALLGMNKAAAAAHHVAQINPLIPVEAVEQFLTEENVHSLVASCDIVLDGLDQIHARKVLAAECKKAGVPLVYGAVSGWVAQAALCAPGDDLIEKLYPPGTVLRGKSVLSFTPALCAAMQVSLCVQFLTGRPVKNGTVYYFDLSNQEFESIPMI